jgi:lipid A 3-O-deacylase
MGTGQKLIKWLSFANAAVIFLWVAAGTGGWAQEFSLESAGARFGIPAGSSGQQFLQAEAFVNWNLPWRWDLGAQWRLDTRLDLSAGWLGAGSIQAALGTLGPSLVLHRAAFPVSLEASISPTLLSTGHFESKNFGTPFQFATHTGLNWDFAPHLRLGYRFQHMSNAGLSSHNPGLNLHLFGLSYFF